MFFVVAHHVFERGGDAVVKVWRARGQSAQGRRLEETKIIPMPRDVAKARVGQLSRFASLLIAESVERQIRRARFRRRGVDVEHSVVEAGSVVYGVVTCVAALVADVGPVEYFLPTSDLRALRVRIIHPSIKEIETPFILLHGG